MGKTVGYFEGTDPQLLNNLVARGIGTMPLSNGFDSHGRQVIYLTKRDQIDLVVGYFYKVVPPTEMSLTSKERSWTLKDILASCVEHEIPVILIAGEELHQAATDVVGGIPEGVRLVALDKIVDEVLKVVGS